MEDLNELDKAPTSKTTVVNIYKEPCDVYIGRGKDGKVPKTPETKGWLGNPFTVKEYGDKAISMFEVYFYERMSTDEKFRSGVIKLKGKKLGCFCKPKACHGDVISEFLNNVDEIVRNIDNGNEA